MSDKFPYFEFSGSRAVIGRQHGRMAGEIVHRHLEMALGKLAASDISHQEARGRAGRYMPFIEDHTPKFAEELRGLAEGAEIAVEDAYILQLRAELAVKPGLEMSSAEAALARDSMANECTTFAVTGEVTRDGAPIAGQNADLPAGTKDLGIVVKIQPDDGPAILMLTPAGQISYIGINNAGLGVFANFLNTSGWRPGFPRYLFSRTILEEQSLRAGVQRLTSIPRASSRNVLMVDSHGEAMDIEFSVDRAGKLAPKDGILAHSNHFVDESMQDEEQSAEDRHRNSCTRYDRMRELLESERGAITVESTMRFFRDRENAPDSICRHLGDGPDDYITFASVIARPSLGELYVAPGPPDQHEFTRYAF